MANGVDEPCLSSTHMAHHYKDCDYSFGITNTFFDRVFRTKPAMAMACYR